MSDWVKWAALGALLAIVLASAATLGLYALCDHTQFGNQLSAILQICGTFFTSVHGLLNWMLGYDWLIALFNVFLGIRIVAPASLAVIRSGISIAKYIFEGTGE